MELLKIHDLEEGLNPFTQEFPELANIELQNDEIPSNVIPMWIAKDLIDFSSQSKRFWNLGKNLQIGVKKKYFLYCDLLGKVMYIERQKKELNKVGGSRCDHCYRSRDINEKRPQCIGHLIKKARVIMRQQIPNGQHYVNM